MTLWLLFFSAYLLGAIPSAYIAGKALRGLDIRQHGSGNVGATNVFRVLGKGPGVIVLLADILKGFAASAWLPRLSQGGEALPAWAPCAFGVVAVLGHSYTCFLRFKGGKGAATSAGVIFGLAPMASLVIVVAFLTFTAATRMVSVGSLASATVLTPAVLYFHETAATAGQSPLQGPVLWLALTLSILVWIRHAANLRRIAAGTEPRFSAAKEAP